MDHLTNIFKRKSPLTPPNRIIHPIPSVKWLPGTLGLLFLLLGILFIPCAGLQNDEALFSVPIYAGTPESGHITLFGQTVHLMVMTYVGTLKSSFYAVWLNRWRPGLWSVRLPVLIAGVGTIWLFWSLICRTAGRTAAIFGTILLATDALFLLTTVFDWGPVALQHLLLTAAALLVVTFNHNGSKWNLAAAFFLMGLAIWDKALASWTLSALGLAALITFPREIRARLSLLNLTIATLAFSAGASPLIIYNVKSPFATFSGNAKFSASDLDQKTTLLRRTFDGSAVFGYIPRDDWERPERQPHTTIERASLALRDLLGEHRRGLGYWAAIGALLLAPLWWHRRRPVLFALLFCAFAWLQMAFNKDTGGGVHHTILLWPFSLFFIATALAAAADRIPRGTMIASALICLIALSNLLVLNHYYSQFVRYGTSVIWTDAVAPLSKSLDRYRARTVYAMDWGIREVITMLQRGQLSLWNGEGTDLASLLSTNPVFVTHVPGADINPNAGEILRGGATRLGYHETILETVSDRNGRPIFRISEFKR